MDTTVCSQGGNQLCCVASHDNRTFHSAGDTLDCVEIEQARNQNSGLVTLAKGQRIQNRESVRPFFNMDLPGCPQKQLIDQMSDIIVGKYFINLLFVCGLLDDFDADKIIRCVSSSEDEIRDRVT
eukprot:Lithocolla_globosa_v1_NODE_1323_length_2656_cov_23.532696.p3 type:complete len:125 gc:universal NODE_1323_length_2656_cov_23.532696:2501-2127(-)